MKFKLATSKYFYKEEEKEKFEKLGFTFREYKSKYSSEPDTEWTIEGNPEIEFKTLEDLSEFSKEYGRLIFKESRIEIYNGYREWYERTICYNDGWWQ